MKKYLMKIFPLLTAFLLLTISSIPSFAKSTLTYDSKTDAEGNVVKEFTFSPENETYPKDLFDEFKSVMPGDHREQLIEIINNYEDMDIKVSLRAKNKDNGSAESKNFLDYMTLTVKKVDSSSQESSSGEGALGGDTLGGDTLGGGTLGGDTLGGGTLGGDGLVLDNSSDEEKDDALSLDDWVELGELSAGESLELEVSLDVSTEMDDAFQNSNGLVEWEFGVEEIADTVTVTYWKPDPTKSMAEDDYWVYLDTETYKRGTTVLRMNLRSGNDIDGFQSWYTDPLLGQRLNSIVVTLNEDLNLYAGTTIKGSAGGPKVSFYLPDRTLLGSKQFENTGIYSSSAFPKDTNDSSFGLTYEHPGYEFYGWLTDPNDSTSTLSDPYSLSGDLNLYAGLKQLGTVLPQTDSKKKTNTSDSSSSDSDSDSSDSSSSGTGSQSVMSIITVWTGDDSPVEFWLGMCWLAFVLLISTGVVYYRKRRKTGE
jgi:hypothetical protein